MTLKERCFGRLQPRCEGPLHGCDQPDFGQGNVVEVAGRVQRRAVAKVQLGSREIRGLGLDTFVATTMVFTFFASQVSALRGNVQRSGSGGVMWSCCFSQCQKLLHFGSWRIIRILNTAGAATSFLQSGFLCRLGMLWTAGHTWLKIRQMSVLIPYSVRVALIGMKVISAAAMGALFFSSSAPTPDSDPDCTPPEATRLK